METLQVSLNTNFKPQEAALKTSRNLTERVTRYPLKLDSITPLDLGAESSQKAEEFSIDDLLDFSNDELFQLQDDEEPQTEVDPQQPKQHKIVCSPQNYPTAAKSSSVTDDFSSISVPAEDLENLEWLSQFVEDSFCEYSLTYPPGKLAPFAETEEGRSEPEKPAKERDVLLTPVQTKARSKRTRSGLRVWPQLREPEPEAENGNYLVGAAEKKLKKKGGDEFGGTQQRRCSHCGVQKTPQWRAGPLGSKTLCNACGVRFKSGRLLPEYRPACSPTFSNELHSNSHRKVLEMRRKKEVENEVGDTGSEFLI